MTSPSDDEARIAASVAAVLIGRGYVVDDPNRGKTGGVRVMMTMQGNERIVHKQHCGKYRTQDWPWCEPWGTFLVPQPIDKYGRPTDSS